MSKEIQISKQILFDSIKYIFKNLVVIYHLFLCLTLIKI